MIFPRNIRKEFGKRHGKVHAAFDGITYEGIIVKMSVKDAEGTVCLPLTSSVTDFIIIGRGEAICFLSIGRNDRFCNL